MSPSSRIAGSTGKHHSFWAMYSLRMSAWIVPPSRSRGTPCVLRRDDVERHHDRRRRVDRHRHRDLAEVDAAEQRRHVVDGVDRDALAADLAERRAGGRSRGPSAIGMSNAVAEPGLAVVEQVAEALVGLLGGAEARRTGASSRAGRGTCSGTRRACTGTRRAARSRPASGRSCLRVERARSGRPTASRIGASRSGVVRVALAPLLEIVAEGTQLAHRPASRRWSELQ